MSKPSQPDFRTAYDDRQKSFSDATATDFTVPLDDDDYHPSRSLTNQSDAEELDINVIMARYLKTGLVPQSLVQPFFGDASAMPDFMTAQQIIIEGNNAFESLPAKIRDRFNNSPVNFLEFMGNPDNEAEARFLGLLETPQASAGDAERPTAGVADPAPAPFQGQE